MKKSLLVILEAGLAAFAIFWIWYGNAIYIEQELGHERLYQQLKHDCGTITYASTCEMLDDPSMSKPLPYFNNGFYLALPAVTIGTVVFIFTNTDGFPMRRKSQS